MGLWQRYSQSKDSSSSKDTVQRYKVAASKCAHDSSHETWASWYDLDILLSSSAVDNDMYVEEEEEEEEEENFWKQNRSDGIRMTQWKWVVTWNLKFEGQVTVVQKMMLWVSSTTSMHAINMHDYRLIREAPSLDAAQQLVVIHPGSKLSSSQAIRNGALKQQGFQAQSIKQQDSQAVELSSSEVWPQISQAEDWVVSRWWSKGIHWYVGRYSLSVSFNPPPLQVTALAMRATTCHLPLIERSTSWRKLKKPEMYEIRRFFIHSLVVKEDWLV